MSNEFKQLSLEYPTKTEAARVYKIIDLFAGIGGIRTGFQQAFRDNFLYLITRIRFRQTH
ncbi:MAG: DNA cytosine methyltransferase [Thiotrichaceae bacterium]|nr:DNA cytosine methyltransferase [Thiotrichaceae bacterium]